MEVLMETSPLELEIRVAWLADAFGSLLQKVTEAAFRMLLLGSLVDLTCLRLERRLCFCCPGRAVVVGSEQLCQREQNQAQATDQAVKLTFWHRRPSRPP